MEYSVGRGGELVGLRGRGCGVDWEGGWGWGWEWWEGREVGTFFGGRPEVDGFG